jgi:hypothetical protein
MTPREQTHKTANQSIELVNNSGIDYIDSLFNNSQGQPIRWISDPIYTNDHSVNASTVITYSLPGLNGKAARYSYSEEEFLGLVKATAFTEEQAIDIRKAFERISDFINITFVEVAEEDVEENGETISKVGTIRLAIRTITDESGVYREGIGATASIPGDHPRGGDIFFNKQYENIGNFASGTVPDNGISDGDLKILYHEIFHALGTEHPGDHPTIKFPESKNKRPHTLFGADGENTFIDGNNIISMDPGIYDIAPLQYLYGANNQYNIGDTIYSYSPNKPLFATIWDAGGVDTLDFSNFTKNQVINLSQGEFCDLSFNNNWSAKKHLGIAFNAIIENAKGGSGADQITGNNYKNNIQGNSGDDIIDGGSDYDIATYSGNFSDYTFIISNQKVTVIDKRSSTNDGTDTLSNIEKLTFADKNALVTSKEVKDINSLGFKSEKVYSGKSDTYKFYDLGSDKYGVETTGGIDELTGASILKFDDKNMHLANDIKATFDQVTGLNTDSGKMFRLYNASFKRLPDPDGLRYWIGNFSSGKDDERAVASSFLASIEFKQRYGENVSDSIYVNTLYKNVLGRDADTGGLNYWLGQLNSGAETRYEVLLGFSESAENKGLFTEMTGFA